MINKVQFEKFVLDPGQLNLATIPELEKLMEAFPYCQTTQLLYVKNLYKEHNIHFNQQLRVAAAYAGDRGLLKKLLEAKSEEEVYQPSSEEVKIEKESPLEGEVRKKDKAGESADDLHLRQKTEETEPKHPDPSIKESGVLAEEEASEGLLTEKEKPTGKADSEATGRDELPEQEKYLELGYPYIEDESPEQEPEVAKTPSERRRKELEKLKVQLHELRLEREKIEKVIREEKNRKAKAKSAELSQKQDRNDVHSSKGEKSQPSERISSEMKRKPAVRQTDRYEERKNEERSQGTGNAKKGKKTSEKSKKELIDEFIKEEPSIRKGAASFYDPTEAARKSIMQSDDIATETLARLYLKQGKVLQAIKIYERLSLKFPEKSDYFARQIQEIKKTNK